MSDNDDHRAPDPPDPDRRGREAYRVPAVVAAVRILDALAGLDAAGASLSQIARMTGRSKSTVFNLLATLEAEGLVAREPAGRHYVLGARLMPLGTAAGRAAHRRPGPELDAEGAPVS